MQKNHSIAKLNLYAYKFKMASIEFCVCIVLTIDLSFKSANRCLVTILIVDDHPFYRAGVKHFLSGTDFSHSIVLEASNGMEAINMAISKHPTIILLDFSMPDMDGYDVSRRILSINPAQRILVMTSYDEIALIQNFFSIGVKGFLTKSLDIDRLEEAIRSVLLGDYYYGTRYTEQIKSWLGQHAMAKIPYLHFTQRERELIRLMAKGFTNKEIASYWKISARTVETYRYDLMEKTGVITTAQLVAYAFSIGQLN